MDAAVNKGLERLALQRGISPIAQGGKAIGREGQGLQSGGSARAGNRRTPAADCNCGPATTTGGGGVLKHGSLIESVHGHIQGQQANQAQGPKDGKAIDQVFKPLHGSSLCVELRYPRPAPNSNGKTEGSEDQGDGGVHGSELRNEDDESAGHAGKSEGARVAANAHEGASGKGGDGDEGGAHSALRFLNQPISGITGISANDGNGGAKGEWDVEEALHALASAAWSTKGRPAGCGQALSFTRHHFTSGRSCSTEQRPRSARSMAGQYSSGTPRMRQLQSVEDETFRDRARAATLSARLMTCSSASFVFTPLFCTTCEHHVNTL
jgi:hypothetical protein